MATKLSSILAIERSKIVNAEHHMLHAYTALYASRFRDEPVLVFTNDGEGDFLSSTVSIYDGNTLKRIASSSYTESLGWLWAETTKYLGMKPDEHEHKVMGLAPYASLEGVKTAKERLFADLITVEDNLQLRAKINLSYCYNRIRPRLDGIRFDAVAGAIQEVTEKVLNEWVTKTIERFKIKKLAFAGGIFMNVKANMRLCLLDSLENAFFMPSAGDESLALGCAFYGAKLLDQNAKIQPLKDLYLGPDFSDEEVEQAVEKHNHIHVSRHSDINVVATELLSKGEVLARCSGRMEWGARALGNRSILADPKDLGVTRIINQMIKQRDFWMPFAPTIIDSSLPDYIDNPDPIKANPEYMAIAFNTKEKTRPDLAAAMHAYDFTIRPQLLSREFNEDYYELMTSFSAKTGRGGILNTSFNLHGEPIVCTPEDALSTLERSGLRFLILGNHLIEKD